MVFDMTDILQKRGKTAFALISVVIVISGLIMIAIGDATAINIRGIVILLLCYMTAMIAPVLIVTKCETKST